MQQRELYKRIGGEQIIHALVQRFYDVMDTNMQAREIRALHPADLGESREKLFKFLVGWSGGPPLYVQEYGHPRLRARHLPFSIGTVERDQWMYCMRIALAECVVDEEVRSYLDEALLNLADFMRNKIEAGSSALKTFVDKES